MSSKLTKVKLILSVKLPKLSVAPPKLSVAILKILTLLAFSILTLYSDFSTAERREGSAQSKSAVATDRREQAEVWK